jgi:hypothetical protein
VRKLLKDALKVIDVKMEEMVEASAKKEQDVPKLATAPLTTTFCRYASSAPRHYAMVISFRC